MGNCTGRPHGDHEASDSHGVRLALPGYQHTVQPVAEITINKSKKEGEKILKIELSLL